jgi:biopolymer transport protein ExbD
VRKRKRRTSQEEVELNLAAMLDMAFQLLAFFILTFNPAPLEGQIALRMPPPEPVSRVQGEAIGSPDPNADLLKGLDTLELTVLSDGQGGIGKLQIAQGAVMTSLRDFELRLTELFSDPNIVFEQVLLQIGSGLKYEHMMSLMDVCTRIKLPSGEPLNRLSFIEINEQPKAAE